MTDRPAHAGDLVSAWLDGELDEGTAAWVDDHVRSCNSCAAIAAEAGAARSWVRAAPTVDASPLVEQVIARRRRLVGTGMAFVGAAMVVLGLLSMTASVTHPSVVPDVEMLAAAHRGSSHAVMDGMRTVDDGGRRYATPPSLAGAADTLHRHSVYDRRDLTTVVYEGPGGRVSLFEQPGRLDWDALLDGGAVGAVERLDGRAVWVRDGGTTVLVTEVGHLVVTVVGDDGDTVRAVVSGLPAPERTSLLDRIHDSCQRLTEIFALGG